MTPEKQIKDPKAHKQKIIIGVIVVIVLIVIWQFIDLSGGGSSAPSLASTPSLATKPGAANMGSITPTAQEQYQPKQEKISMSSDLSKMQLQAQTEYVSSLTKLQMLKLQREIDETKMAIATAELNRMTAEKNIADLITTKQDIQPEVTPVPVTSVTTATPIPPPPPAQITPAPIPDFVYSVLSVSYQGRKWAAVIGAQGKLVTVGVGDTLQPDGSIIVAIDRQGVVLKKNAKTRTISINSAM